MQEGGKLLGQGSYGCVFKPHIRCIDRKKKRVNNGVGKVFEDHDEYEQEVQINNLVTQNADPDGKFTLPILATCEVRQPRNQADVMGCRQFSTNKDVYDQIIFPYAGKSVKDILSQKGTTSKFWKMFIAFRPLLEGLVRFEQLGYVHCDIKPHNIMVKKGQMLLIDFGLWGRSFDIYKKYRVPLLNSNNPYYPPEFKLRFNKKKDFTEQQFRSKFLENFGSTQKAKKLFDTLAIKLDTDLSELYNNSPSTNEYTTFADKIDVYSIGMVFYRLLEWCGYTTKEYKRQTPQAVLVRDLKAMLSGMVAINPRKRLSPQAALDKYRDILKLHECLKQKTKDIKANLPTQQARKLKSKSKHCVDSLQNE